MDVRLPDGTLIQGVPDGMTRADLTAKLKANGYDVSKLANPAAAMPAMDPTEGMSSFELGAAGVGKAAYDAARGIGQLIPGLVSRQDVADSRARDAALMNRGEAIGGNLLGNALIYAPTALVPGAQTIGGGALLGAGLGYLQPSASTSETLGNTGFGTIAGAAVPLLSRAYQSAKSTVEPLYEAGKNAIVGRALNSAAGSDASAVAQRLSDAVAPFYGPSQGLVQRATMGELVPGSMPTVGQAAGNAGVASLERAATATTPEMTNAVSDLMKRQNQARVAVLERLAGSDGERAFVAANRDATAEQLYGAAKRLGVDPAKLTPEALQNIAQFSERIPNEVLNQAKKLAKINGEQMTDATSIQGMHWIKKAIDGLISKESGPGGNATLKRAYVGLQNDLLEGMDKLSPAYAQARSVYAEMSKPLNQMETVQAIADKSINSLTGNLQPNAFANALSDKTAQRATGFKGATLENTLTNAQRNELQGLLQDVQRSTVAQNAGRGVGSDTVQKLAYTNMLDRAGVPTFLREFAPSQVAGNLLSRGADTVYARANRELSYRLAEVMLDPGRASELMRLATPVQRAQIVEMLKNVGTSGLLLSAPASAKAVQQ